MSRSLVFTSRGARESRAKASEDARGAIALTALRIRKLMESVDDSALHRDPQLRTVVLELHHALGGSIDPLLKRVETCLRAGPLQQDHETDSPVVAMHIPGVVPAVIEEEDEELEAQEVQQQRDAGGQTARYSSGVTNSHPERAPQDAETEHAMASNGDRADRGGGLERQGEQTTNKGGGSVSTGAETEVRDMACCMCLPQRAKEVSAV